MPFPFLLPTTSILSYPAYLKSSTHPSLPQAATTHRNILRSILKRHKRLDQKSRSSNLSTILSALQDYLPYLFALNASLNGQAIHGEDIQLVLHKELEVEWRSTLTSPNIPGREMPRIKGRGIDYEITFVLNTLAIAYVMQARSSLLLLYGVITPTAEQRASIITTASKNLLEANSMHAYLSTHSSETDASSAVVECLSQTQSALAALSMAEATLLAVLKDDPFPAIVAQDRNKNDKEWMISAPEIPKVRAHLFARLCLAAAEHAGKAEAMFSASGRVSESILRYVGELQKTARAKACRFFGINAELAGETGTGLAWLTGGKRQLGFAPKDEEGKKLSSLARLKKDWTERREDRKVEKGEDWGSDGGRFEELRIIDILEQKWNKQNDTINTQLVPPSEPLIASMPSGRDVHPEKAFAPPVLDEETLSRMRAPLGRDAEMGEDANADSSDEGGEARIAPPGAFPGSAGSAANDNPYY